MKKGRYFMVKIWPAALLIVLVCAQAAVGFERDVIESSAGDIEITFIGHGSLMFSFSGITIHVDPWSRMADYGKLPKADIVLITHEHSDHLDEKALEAVRKKDTATIITSICSKRGAEGFVMENGDTTTLRGIRIVALPAYNIRHNRGDGSPFHPKGAGNGYLIHFGDTRVYVAGDTENISEMADIAGIDIAFLPMNLPYTMTPEMTADAAKVLRPRILYPYHYGDADTGKLIELLRDIPDIEVRIRKM
jgi:L-ascorbate metabolism protein UlaG (beta-lactamase superfamily)